MLDDHGSGKRLLRELLYGLQRAVQIVVVVERELLAVNLPRRRDARLLHARCNIERCLLMRVLAIPAILQFVKSQSDLLGKYKAIVAIRRKSPREPLADERVVLARVRISLCREPPS